MSTVPSGSRQRWLVPVVVVVLSVTIGGGLLARELYRPPDVAETSSEPVVSASTSATPLSPAQEPGPDTVQITDDVAGHPQNDVVRPVIQNYFVSINKRDYGLWAKVVSQDRLNQQTQSDWLKAFKTTKDGSILIYRIERGTSESLRVLVGFTSVQALADAPEYFRETCIRWRLVLPLVPEKGGYRVATVEPGTVPEHDKC